MICMKRYLGAIALFGLLVLAACTKAGENSNSVKGIDITEAIPVHESSLEYFEFVATYCDNSGLKEVVNINDVPLNSIDCYVKTYRYNECPVSCMATVELVPKVPESEVVSFTFIIPKPLLYENVHSSSNVESEGVDTVLPESYERIKIESMEIGEFMSKYGTMFSSACTIYEDGEGGVKVISY